jgi:hypothetical protein
METKIEKEKKRRERKNRKKKMVVEATPFTTRRCEGKTLPRQFL